jgi:hypothetical protein
MIPALTGILAAAGGGVASSYESISTVTVGSGGSASVTFSSIPATFAHLQVRGILRSTAAVAVNQSMLQINGNTSTSSYAFHQIYGNGTAAGAEGYPTGTLGGVAPFTRNPGASATSGMFGAVIMDILDYTNTNKYKTVRIFYGYDANGTGQVGLTSGLYLPNTNAITQLDITIQGGGNYAQYSSLALYGVKA